MAKRIRPYYQIIALILVIAIAAFLRLYRIGDLTEFLGDQGRTGMEIYRDWHARTLPLIGPTVLTGENIGPAFYYIVAPAFILTGFNALAPAIWTAIIGTIAVAVLWWIGNILWGWKIAAMIALLWAVSPQIVSSSRVLWEPNLVPFFALCFVLGVLQLDRYHRHLFWWGVVSGASVGILIQLHYPDFLFLALVFLVLIKVWFKKENKPNRFLQILGGVFVGFVVTTLPFFIYESTHQFRDIVGVLGGFFSGSGDHLSKRQILFNILDYASRMIRRVVPYPAGWEAISLLILISIAIIKRSFWVAFFVCWFLVGVSAIALYRGTVFDHYLFFVLPVPFLVSGYLLSFIKEKMSIWVSLLIVSAVVLLQLGKTDIVARGPRDIPRTEQAAQTILNQAQGGPFAFGLIASRSFLDFHYRYFFLINKHEAEPYVSRTYQNLFLVCENEGCPTVDELASQGGAQLVCYDAHCSGTYPIVDFKEWKFIRSTDTSGARIYLLERI